MLVWLTFVSWVTWKLKAEPSGAIATYTVFIYLRRAVIPVCMFVEDQVLPA